MNVTSLDWRLKSSMCHMEEFTTFWSMGEVHGTGKKITWDTLWLNAM